MHTKLTAAFSSAVDAGRGTEEEFAANSGQLTATSLMRVSFLMVTID